MTAAYTIYEITSTQSDRVYYGSTEQSLRARWVDHDAALRFNRHFNHELQNLYNQGIRDWTITKIGEAVDKEDARQKEKLLVRANSKALNVLFSGRRGRPEPCVDDLMIETAFDAKIAGMKQYHIAKLIGVSECTVSYIVRNIHYLHSQGLRLKKLVSPGNKKGFYTSYEPVTA